MRADPLFSGLTLAPRDPILGLNEAFQADTRPSKVNLGVGVYTDENGKLPLLACVREAEARRLQQAPARGYQPIEGPAGYNLAVQKQLLGAGHPVVAEKRAVTVEALGGTGALKIGADLLRRMLPGSKVAISDPSWENHRAIFEMAGFEVCTYPYYQPTTRGLDFDGMMAGLSALPSGTIVVLHACCHNPTGVDLSTAQWTQVVEAVRAQGLVPFLDMAYQGFGDGLEPDAAAVRMMADSGLSFLVASSFSKSFSLYGERVGALTLVTSAAEEATRVLSQVKRVIRTNYSNPPTHGAALVTAVLTDEGLCAQWDAELGQMRERIKAMRSGLKARLEAAGVTSSLDYIVQQRGMFSYTGLTAAQVEHMRAEHGVYAVSSGRVCMAAINLHNLDAVATAIAEALKQ